MVFSKPLANGDRAVALYNPSDAPRRIATTTAQTGLGLSPAYQLTDLWTKARTETAGTIAATVPAHGTVLYRVHPFTAWQQLPPATSLDVSSHTAVNGADVGLAAGTTARLTTTLHNAGRDALADVRVQAGAASGWTLTATTPWQTARVGDATVPSPWTGG